MRLLHSIPLSVICALVTITTPGRCQVRPYKEWLTLLSVKHDQRSENYRTVFEELRKVDSSSRCSVLDTLSSMATSQNIRLQIRLLEMEGRVQAITPGLHCAQLKTPVEQYEKALTLAYDLDDDILLFQLYKDLASYYAEANLHGQAILYGLLTKELYDKYGKQELFPMYATLHILALSLYHSRDYQTCVSISKLFLQPDNGYLSDADKEHPIYDMFSWNTLGLAYFKLNQPDSAFWAYDHALAVAKSIPDPFWISLVTGNKGDVYFKLGQLDSAETMLAFDYKGSLAARQYDNAANSLQWLARIDLMHHHPQEALRKARTADSLLQISSKPDFKSNTWLTFTKIFASLGQPDSVSVYLDKFLPLHDSLEQSAADNRDANVRMRLHSQEQIQKIKALNKEKENVALVRNLIIVIILFSAAIGFMILNRQKLQLKVRRQEALEEKLKAESESVLAKEQLKLYMQNLIEKTTLVESLHQQLQDQEMSEERKNYIAELSMHAILTDEDWDHFKSLFEKVYPAFFYHLKQIAPDLTTADQRMAALSKLQLSNKEAASLLGIAPNSVIKARQRLRHRFGLQADADLEYYFSNSPEFS